MIDETHDEGRSSWVPGADAHPDFPIQNLPLGVFSTAGTAPRCGVAIGDHVLDLAAAAHAGALARLEWLAAAAARPSLNAVFARSKAERVELRLRLVQALEAAADDALRPHLIPAAACTLHLPAEVGDFTDFFAGIHHARTAGAMFRPQAPLLPNYGHVPVGYHGRASTVRVSGEPVTRPLGQSAPEREGGAPGFGPCRALDYETEMAVWVGGPPNAPGRPPASPSEAYDRVAGFGLLNDWSARDIQRWEAQPLGPFLAKSFHTTVSPWVVTAEALAPFGTRSAARTPADPPPLPHLDDAAAPESLFAVEIETRLAVAGREEAQVLARAAMADLYWSPAQMLAHHASNGCVLHPGDLLGTGTISGPERREQAGCLLELTLDGREPIRFPGGEERTYLQDGDTVTLQAHASRAGSRTIGFGSAGAQVRPSPRG